MLFFSELTFFFLSPKIKYRKCYGKLAIGRRKLQMKKVQGLMLTPNRYNERRLRCIFRELKRRAARPLRSCWNSRRDSKLWDFLDS
ncbi:hypothetical protein Y032_0573g153 [Ancylostoma ceylanicum]|nr:hypothetical protein Y032_0573g153 [Ancylostoma ceylanicum]